MIFFRVLMKFSYSTVLNGVHRIPGDTGAIPGSGYEDRAVKTLPDHPAAYRFAYWTLLVHFCKMLLPSPR